MSQQIEPHDEVWNRSTTGVPYSPAAGDVSLAHALRFDGYAQGEGVLAAIETEVGEERAGEGQAGFAWFGLTEVIELLSSTLRDYDELDRSGLEGEPHAERFEEIDAKASARYQQLEVTDLLTVALRQALVERPEDFAPRTGSPVEPRLWGPGETPPTEDPPQQLRDHTPVGGREAYARDVTTEEKLLRSAQALTAFGLEAEVEDGYLIMHPWSDGEDDLINAVLGLLDLRYP